MSLKFSCLLVLVVSFSKSNFLSCSARKGVLRNFAKSKGKHLCQSLFFNKVAGLRPAASLKKGLCHLLKFSKKSMFLWSTFCRS